MYRLTGRRELGRSAGQQTHMLSHDGNSFDPMKPIFGGPRRLELEQPAGSVADLDGVPRPHCGGQWDLTNRWTETYLQVTSKPNQRAEVEDGVEARDVATRRKGNGDGGDARERGGGVVGHGTAS